MLCIENSGGPVILLGSLMSEMMGMHAMAQVPPMQTDTAKPTLPLAFETSLSRAKTVSVCIRVETESLMLATFETSTSGLRLYIWGLGN